ncbi:MAG: aminoacyl-tRNA deacylase [Deltaproteobacteria bacterium]|nr:aminoacyl-tRNA deacylase [Deltaproteobacteria bacterium]
MKTNAVRILESLGVPHALRHDEVDEADLSAEAVARKVGLPESQVFKTLVCRGDRHGPCFAVVPAGAELDLKALARLSGDRKCDTVPLKEVTPLTGYVRGGVTVFSAKKPFPAFVDDSMFGFPEVAVSAGARDTQVVLAPGDDVHAVKAKTGMLSRPKAG